MALTEERYNNPDIDITNAINTARKEAKEEGIAEGIEKGMAEGMEKGMAEGIEKGLAEGMERGIEKAHLETARKMKEKGFDNKEIAELTGLSEHEIRLL